ncbi:MAG: hypothetical protein J6A69_13015 [Clostridia bacterium]|nr:hypothetical protein [Clostridia bacterium]
MHCIHAIFSPEQISLTQRFSKNLTCFSVEGAPKINADKYTSLYPVNLFTTFDRFKSNVNSLAKIEYNAVIILPPFPEVADFYTNFCQYVILRFEGKRKYYKDNYPDMRIEELEEFCHSYKGDKSKILFEISALCKDCNINRQSFNYFSLSQAKLKQYVNGSKMFFDKNTMHNYYTYCDENDEVHIMWYEDNDSISEFHNIIKENDFGGISWKNPVLAADGNWEAMNAVYSHLKN